MFPGSIPRRPAVRRLSTLGLALLVLSSHLWAPFVRGEGEPPPRAPTQREIDGYRAALQDPDDAVVTVALYYERAYLILRQLGALPNGLAERVVDIWLAHPRGETFRTLAQHDGLAAVVEDRIGGLLATNHPERCAFAAFFAQRPERAAEHKRALTECLVEWGDPRWPRPDGGLWRAADELFTAQPRLLDLSPETFADWLHSPQSNEVVAAVWAATFSPELAKTQREALSKLLPRFPFTVPRLFGKHPELFELPPETFDAWLRHSDVRGPINALAAADLNPDLAKAHTHTLTELLISNAPSVQQAAREFFEKHSALLNLPPETLSSWLGSNAESQKAGALHATALIPSLAEGHTRALSELLGDEEKAVRDAAHQLIKDNPKLLDLTPETFDAWLGNNIEGQKLGALHATALSSSLAAGHTRALTELLGDEEKAVRDAAHQFIKDNPKLLDLAPATFNAWLGSSNPGQKLGALHATALGQSLAEGHTIVLSMLLGDDDETVRDAAHQLIKDNPKLFNLTPATLDAWLGSNLQGQKLGFLHATALMPSLAKDHTRALSELLGDESRAVREAVYTLFVTQPKLMELTPETFAVWLGSNSQDKRHGAVLAASLMPDLAARHTRALIELMVSLAPSDGDSEGDPTGERVAMLLESRPDLLDVSGLAELMFKEGTVEVTERAALLAALIPNPGPEKLVPFLDLCHRDPRLCPSARLAAHLAGGGRPELEEALTWLGRPKGIEKRLKVLAGDAVAAHDQLDHFAVLWPATEGFDESRKDLADRVVRLAASREGSWGTADLPRLALLRGQIKAAGFPTGALDQAIAKSEAVDWVKKGGMVLAGHAAFWALLIFLYPRLPMVQALFFWNPWVRRIAGFGYVSLLLAWVPWLRRLLFSPFRTSLLADAALDDFDQARYFPNSPARRAGAPRDTAQPVAQAILAILGPTVLVGESGLGKTMFLRHLVSKAGRVTAFLPAWKCEGGVLEALQENLHGPARDPDYLRTLIYSGAIDLCIDGVNEVGPDTREKIRSFMESFFKGNILLGMQPIDWRLPNNAQVWHLEPLREDQIEAFLISRAPAGLDAAELEGFAAVCRGFLAQALAPDQAPEALGANRRVLSNPMDARVVASMLAQGRTPNLLLLQQQWYDAMAADYREQNAGTAFPLAAFAERVYTMRVKDEPSLPEAEYPAEVAALTRHKMAVPLQFQDGSGKLVKQWRFRHDKVWDFFVVETFLGPDNKRPKECLTDSRFRGVYFLLAEILPLKDARRLREVLIQHAADTKDHSVSDDFVRLLRVREPAGPAGSGRRSKPRRLRTPASSPDPTTAPGAV